MKEENTSDKQLRKKERGQKPCITVSYHNIFVFQVQIQEKT
jgi:hypothetical protein